jgi:hypothetical protein
LPLSYDKFKQSYFNLIKRIVTPRLIKIKQNLKNKNMTKKEFLASNYFKVGFPVLLAALLITLWRDGYEFGQWLHKVLN